MEGRERPKIGVALSGAAGRAITHIGVLEVLRENDIPIDYITACSSATIIASSFASGTMESLKKDWIMLNKKFLLSLLGIDKTGTGMFNSDKFTEWGAKYSLNKKFEDVYPRLGFVCADIITGEQVLLSLGDIPQAGQASCAVPGLFEPVRWGNKLLVDGGLFSIVPTTQAREMGADIVIGVDIASSRYIFDQKLMTMRKGYNFLRKSWPVKAYVKIHDLVDRAFSKSINFIYHNQSDLLEESGFIQPGMFAILGKALDISVEQSERNNGVLLDCDYLISPNVKHHGRTDFESAKNMLIEGRRAAMEAVPAIQKLIKSFQKDKPKEIEFSANAKRNF